MFVLIHTQYIYIYYIYIDVIKYIKASGWAFVIYSNLFFHSHSLLPTLVGGSGCEIVIN